MNNIDNWDKIYTKLTSDEKISLKQCLSFEMLKNENLCDLLEKCDKNNISDVLDDLGFTHSTVERLNAILMIEGVKTAIIKRYSLEEFLGVKSFKANHIEFEEKVGESLPYLVFDNDVSLLNFRNYYYTTKSCTMRSSHGQIDAKSSVNIFDIITQILIWNGYFKLTYTLEEQNIINEWYEKTCKHYDKECNNTEPKYSVLYLTN